MKTLGTGAVYCVGFFPTDFPSQIPGQWMLWLWEPPMLLRRAAGVSVVGTSLSLSKGSPGLHLLGSNPGINPAFLPACSAGGNSSPSSLLCWEKVKLEMRDSGSGGEIQGLLLIFLSFLSCFPGMFVLRCISHRPVE